MSFAMKKSITSMEQSQSVQTSSQMVYHCYLISSSTICSNVLWVENILEQKEILTGTVQSNPTD